MFNERVTVDGMPIHEHPIYQLKEKNETLIDLGKAYVFKIQYFVTLAAIVLVGLYNADLFSVFYLAGAFVFLWFGADLYMKPLAKIISLWDAFFMCNVFIMTTKVLVRIVSCQFGERIPSEYCWIADAFDLPCSTKTSTAFCRSNNEDLSYMNDRIAFVFILLQRRIFLSYYFCNVIHETYARSVLASRFVAELLRKFC